MYFSFKNVLSSPHNNVILSNTGIKSNGRIPDNSIEAAAVGLYVVEFSKTVLFHSE
jgi:hypothetical protein